MADGRVYMLQPSFATGEISPDVASRVDLDKYQSALLQAKNFYIRPYGSAYRRPGTIHIANLASGNILLQEFAVDADRAYLLEFGNQYLNVWKDGVKKKTLTTPFTGTELHKLRFAQSADVMFIASGTYPVQVLTRAADTSWTMTEFIPEPGYFDATTMKDGVTITPSATTGTVTLTASGSAFTAGQVGNWVRTEQKREAETINFKNGGSQTSITETLNAYVSGWRLTTSGSWGGEVKVQRYSNGSWVNIKTYTSTGPGYNVNDSAPLEAETSIRAEVSVTSGNVTATLTRLAWEGKAIFEERTRTHPSQSTSVSCAIDTSRSILAGEKGWKVTSHGTWAGSFYVEYSTDNVHWKTLRSYSSNSDYNPTESGTFDKPAYVRVRQAVTSGSIIIDLMRFPYTHKATARITGYTDATHVTAQVKDKFADTSACEEWAFGSWSADYGYPSCVTFFQDRLCLAANNRYPYMVWMSRTADYYNFGTEEVEGTLTDDSAVAISFISRRDFRIKHLVAQSDLIVMTEGNEWIVSGSSTVKPTDVNPQVQTSRGTTDVIPILVGGQMIYVQRHGRTVRDLQYNYTTDSYDGMDLTILAKHITQDAPIVDAAYRQEPDYMMWFVLDDGTAACLTYINEQKVYAWSRMITDGTIKAVETITTSDEEDVYFVVERNGVNYLERLADMADTDDPDDYIMLDCAKQGTNSTASNIITAAWLANRTVDVLADGRHIENLEADEYGNVVLGVPCERYVVGLPYNSLLELPNIETQMQDGTMQGRKKKVSAAILRLRNSLAGRVGITEAKTDVIKYDELMAQTVTLFSGEKNVTVPNVTVGGFNDWGRIVITSDAPYPLSVASIVRAVVNGG